MAAIYGALSGSWADAPSESEGNARTNRVARGALNSLGMEACRVGIVVVALAAIGCSRASPSAGYAPMEGDVVFQALPQSPLVNAIEGATRCAYSHCGLVVREASGRLAVLEAFRSVREVPIDAWIERGRGGAITVHRFREPFAERIPEIVAAARRFAGRPYDVRYRMDDEAIYCSELLYKAFLAVTGERLGRTQTLGELEWRPFETFIRESEGGALPLDREMITPRALSEAESLREVFRAGW